MRWALCAVFLAALGLFGCEKVDIYSIDAPSDLQSRIDSITDANASINTGDTTYLDISTTVVGETDFSSEWWTVFSDYFTIPTNELLVVKFINYSDCATSGNNYENWCLAVTNVEGTSTDDDASYAEYFILRSDAYGWGGSMADEDEDYTYNSDMLSYEYPDTDGDGDVWNDFRDYMTEASVTIEIDHSPTGNVYVTATTVATDGTVLVETYEQPVSTTDDIVAFLVNEESYLEIEEAYLIPSQVTTVEDYDPTSIAVEGTPSTIELGSEDFWGDGIATVTYANGYSEEVDTTDISFTVDDLTTVGEKTVILSYRKTKEGEDCDAIVSTVFTLEVTNSVSSLTVTTLPDITTYYYYGNDSVVMDTTGIVVTATYSDGTTAVMDNDNLKFSKIPANTGSQSVVIYYVGASSTVTTTCQFNLVLGVSQVGANDFSSDWWSVFSDDYNIESGESMTLKMYCYSDNLESYHSPLTILRNATQTEYAVVRMDNYGWGDGYTDAVTTDYDWDMDTFTSSISGSYIEITVTNNGDSTADIYYDVTYANGDTHYQKYTGITVDSSDLYCALTTEESYLVFVE